MKENRAYKIVQEEAFKNPLGQSHKLIGVYLPNSIETIEDEAFAYLPNLLYVSEDDLSYIPESVSPKKYTLPQNLKTIGDRAFQAGITDWGYLMITDLPVGLTEIG
jgi:hypothetical protein